MKKMLLAAALCAGIFAFANTELAEAADQQAEKVTSVVQTADTQQLSTAYDDENQRRRR